MNPQLTLLVIESIISVLMIGALVNALRHDSGSQNADYWAALAFTFMTGQITLSAISSYIDCNLKIACAKAFAALLMLAVTTVNWRRYYSNSEKQNEKYWEAMDRQTDRVSMSQALELVPQEHRAEFQRFVTSGEASPEFLAALDENEQMQKAVDIMFSFYEKAFNKFVDLLHPPKG